MTEINFDLESVLENARQKTSLHDFGDNDFKEGLQKLLSTYDNNGYDEKGRKRSRRALTPPTRSRD